MIARAAIAMVAVLAGAVAIPLGCSTANPRTSGAVSTDAADADAGGPSVDYPTLNALYEGNIGMYRTCGPNNAVCHNSHEFPNFATVGSIVEDIGLPCNQDRTIPTQVHDLCERAGDRLVIGSTQIEIAWLEDADPSHAQDPLAARIWRVILHDVAPALGGQTVSIVRPPGVVLHALTGIGVVASNDTSHGGKAVVLTLPAPGSGGVDVGAAVAG
jgi:hypothetical protein